MPSDFHGAVWPDPMWGIFNMIYGAEVPVSEASTRTIRPWFTLPDDVYSQTDETYVHLVKHHVQTGAIDRVVEVRMTIYGRTATESDQIAEILLSYLCGLDVEAPPSDEAPAYYFDFIEHRDGPVPQQYPGDSVSPSVMTVAVGARPMN